MNLISSTSKPNFNEDNVEYKEIFKEIRIDQILFKVTSI